jgi:hypothetical protein
VHVSASEDGTSVGCCFVTSRVEPEPPPPFPLLQLPAAVLSAVLARAPVDVRARCACVCRALRAAAADPAAWTDVDLTRAGGLTCRARILQRRLAALAPRLAQTRELRVQPDELFSVWRNIDYDDTAALQVVLGLVRDGHARSLRVLHFADLTCRLEHPSREPREQALRALLAEAPALARLELGELQCDSQRALALLRTPRVRAVRCVLCWPLSDPGAAHAPEPTLEEVFDALEQHAGLEALSALGWMQEEEQRAAFVARIVDFALTRRLVALSLWSLPRSSAPHLARLMREGAALRRLTLDSGSACGAVGGTAALLADALRANTTLRELELRGMCTWCIDTHRPRDGPAGAAVCASLVGHPSVTSVILYNVLMCGRHRDANFCAMDASLAALLRANAPALTTLKLKVATAPDDQAPALWRMFRALAHNTHLRVLELEALRPSAAFLRCVVLPAVRANTSLRELRLGLAWQARRSLAADRALDAAEQLVAARAR